MVSIAASLGIGSGIDTQSLVEQLSTASKAPKEAAIKKREESNTARISSLGSITSGIDGFASALSSLISGGSLFTQPTSSDASIVGVSPIAGARLGNLAAQLEVKQLAQAQSIVSPNLAGTNTPIGQGQITLTTANGTFPITINSGNDSLLGLARAINSASAGVTASIIEDTAGSRLVLKGATGDAQSFKLAVDPAADPGLAKFAFDAATYDPLDTSAMKLAQKAQDAIVKLDGVEVRRVANSFSDLIPGVKIDLKKEAIGTSVAIGSVRQTEAIAQAVSDFVAAFNEMKSVLDEATAPQTGPLRGDVGVRELQRQLSRLTSTVLSSAGGPSTLAEIGIRTERNGTLSVDTTRLNAMIASDPDGVEALFNPGQTASSPLIRIVSPYGRAKPGTYEVKDLVAGSLGNPASGKIGGADALAAGGQLISSIAAPSKGLIIEPLGNLAEGTITVDLGLGGALQALRDSLRATSGPLASSSSRLTGETKAIASDREKMEARADTYRSQLIKQFTTMDSRVSAYKATQSYLDQQVKMWTNSDS